MIKILQIICIEVIESPYSLQHCCLQRHSAFSCRWPHLHKQIRTNSRKDRDQTQDNEGDEPGRHAAASPDALAVVQVVVVEAGQAGVLTFAGEAVLYQIVAELAGLAHQEVGARHAGLAAEGARAFGAAGQALLALVVGIEEVGAAALGAVHVGDAGSAGIPTQLTLRVLVQEVPGHAGSAHLLIEAGVAVGIAECALGLAYEVPHRALSAPALVAVQAVLGAGSAGVFGQVGGVDAGCADAGRHAFSAQGGTFLAGRPLDVEAFGAVRANCGAIDYGAGQAIGATGNALVGCAIVCEADGAVGADAAVGALNAIVDAGLAGGFLVQVEPDAAAAACHICGGRIILAGEAVVGAGLAQVVRGQVVGGGAANAVGLSHALGAGARAARAQLFAVEEVPGIADGAGGGNIALRAMRRASQAVSAGKHGHENGNRDESVVDRHHNNYVSIAKQISDQWCSSDSDIACRLVFAFYFSFYSLALVVLRVSSAMSASVMKVPWQNLIASLIISQAFSRPANYSTWTSFFSSFLQSSKKRWICWRTCWGRSFRSLQWLTDMSLRATAIILSSSSPWSFILITPITLASTRHMISSQTLHRTRMSRGS